MASVFEFDYSQKHGVAESTDMLATRSGGHFYNVVSTEAVDNGSVIAVPTPEKYKEQDYYEAVKAVATDKIALVLTAPKIYEQYATRNQEECFFFNAAGELMRVYEVYETDRFTLSKEAFGEDAAPAVGQYVKVDAGKLKLTTVGEEPTGVGFVGYIYAVAPNGNFRVFVKRNRPVEA